MPSDPSLVRGTLTKVTLAATAVPVAGLTLATVPTGAQWELVTGSVKVITSAAAGSRNHIITIGPTAAPFDQFVTTSLVAASTTVIYDPGAILSYGTSAGGILRQSLAGKHWRGAFMLAGDNLIIKDEAGISATDTAQLIMSVFQKLALPQ